MNGELTEATSEVVFSTDYLQELFKDKKTIQSHGMSLKHAVNLLDKEIALVKEHLFKTREMPSIESSAAPDGKIISKQEKIFLPVKENPHYNFVGRILGPRGYTAKQLEQKLDCKIMIRGRGSMRDPSKEDQNRGKPNWEHLNEELHILINISDYESRIDQKLMAAKEYLSKFVEEGLSIPESQDTLKQMQLMELSILNESDRIQQQQQRQQALLQQSVANMPITPTVIDPSLLKLPILTTQFLDQNQNLSLFNLPLQTTIDPLQLLPLNPTWFTNQANYSSNMIQPETLPTQDSISTVSPDQTAQQLYPVMNNSTTINYLNYSVPGPLKIRADQRTHPYSRM